jgi:hypothetical protein
MAIIAKNSGGDFKLVPEGSHPAVCDMVVDLGIQQGGRFDPKHQVYLRWQIPGERIKIDNEDKPAIIGRTFTLSLSDKSNLRPFLRTWRGRDFTSEEIRGFDITKLAGQPCLLSVTHREGNDGNTYADAAGAMKLPEGMPAPKAEGEVIVYDDEHLDAFDKLRPWLQDKIKNQLQSRDSGPAPGSNHYTDGTRQAAFDTDLDDDVPF